VSGDQTNTTGKEERRNRGNRKDKELFLKKTEGKTSYKPMSRKDSG